MKSKTVVLIGLILLVGYLLYAKGGAGYARVKTAYKNHTSKYGHRKHVITGTARKGNDSGGVLTMSAGDC